jgi:hypothetical protein
MPICKKCYREFPNRVLINGKHRVIHRRVYCLECSPFNKHNTRQIHLPKRRKLDSNYKYKKAARAKRKKQLVEMLGGRCLICGYDTCFQSMDFHHVDPDTKEFGVCSLLVQRSWEEILKETMKTILLCRNCHGEVEAGLHDDRKESWMALVLDRLDKAKKADTINHEAE